MNWISFTLYGGLEKYTGGAVKNAMQAREAYPGFGVRFYVCGRTVPRGVIGQLQAAGASVVVVDDSPITRRMLWRLMILDEPATEIALFRDVDSRITPREVAAVAEWRSTGLAGHVMWDFPYHTNPVMGGMWGIDRSRVPGISVLNLWRVFSEVAPVPGRNDDSDQDFLNWMIWPRIKGSVCLHDGLGMRQEARPFPLPWDEKAGFVGEIYEVVGGVDQSIPSHRRKREEYVLCQGR